MRRQDMAFLARVYRSTRLDELSHTGWSAAEIDGFLQMQFDAQHAHYQEHYKDADWWIIQLKSKPVGRLYVEEWPSELRLIDIALLPSARGGGNGTAILKDLIDSAAAKSKSLGIHVEKNNPAMTLYKRLGFQKSEDKGVYDLLHWRTDQLNTAS